MASFHIYGVILHLSTENINRRSPEELRNEQIGRIVINLLRLSDLLDHALFHDNDHIGNAHGFFLIVGDEDRCDFGFTLDPAQLLTGLQAESGIQIG